VGGIVFSRDTGKAAELQPLSENFEGPLIFLWTQNGDLDGFKTLKSFLPDDLGAINDDSYLQDGKAVASQCKGWVSM
jgi:hypothetical protein